MGFSNVGKVWTPASLEQELARIRFDKFRPVSVTFHHAASPSLANRPKGLLAQHIINIQSFYQNTNGWSSGPHLFVDEDQLFGMCPFNERGIHAVAFNKDSIGIEVLGDYDSEDPKSGRGLQCWENAFAAAAKILERLGLEANSATIKFHCEDPSTKKTCPGKKVTNNTQHAKTDKSWVIAGVRKYMNAKQPLVTESAEAWTVLINSIKIGDYKTVNGRVFVPTRLFIIGLGGDPKKISFDAERRHAMYGDFLLEDDIQIDGASHTPIRTLADLLDIELVVGPGRVISATVNV